MPNAMPGAVTPSAGCLLGSVRRGGGLGGWIVRPLKVVFYPCLVDLMVKSGPMPPIDAPSPLSPDPKPDPSQAGKSAPRWVLWMSRVSWFIAALPAALVAVNVIYALHLRLLIGHRPGATMDDPDTVLFRLNGYVLFLVLYLVMLGIPLWPFLGAIQAFFGAKFRWTVLKQGLAIVGFLGLLILMARYDPSGYFTWLMD